MCKKQQDLQLSINLTGVFVFYKTPPYIDMTISNYLNIELVLDAEHKLQNSKW